MKRRINWYALFMLNFFMITGPSLCFAFADYSPFSESEIPFFLRLVLILAGIVLVCAGFYLYEFLIALPGFIIGAVLGSAVLQDHNVIIIFFGAIFMGIIGAVIALFLFKLILFLSGALVGAVLLSLLSTEPLILIIGGVICGIITLALWKFIGVVVTSFLGAVSLCLGTNSINNEWILVIITIAGIAIQYGVTKNIKWRPSMGKLKMKEEQPPELPQSS